MLIESIQITIDIWLKFRLGLALVEFSRFILFRFPRFCLAKDLNETSLNNLAEVTLKRCGDRQLVYYSSTLISSSESRNSSRKRISIENQDYCNNDNDNGDQS